MKEFFTQLITHNFGTKMISIVVAVVLWLTVLGSRSMEITKEVRLRVLTAADVVPANNLPDKVAFRIVGPKAFLRGVLNRTESPLTVDLSNAKPGLVTYRFYPDNIRLPLGLRVQGINPNSILIKLEEVVFRRLPVRIELGDQLPEGYEIGEITVVPDQVQLRGAKSRISKLRNISTKPIDLSELKADTELTADLDLERHGLELAEGAPKIQIQVKPVSANFRIRNVNVRVLSTHRTKTEFETVTVFVRADSEDLKGLDQSKVYAEVDLRGRSKGKYREKIKITLPKQIGLVKVDPPEVAVTLY